MTDDLARLAAGAEHSVSVAVEDQFGIPLGKLDLDGTLTAGELSAQASAFGLPDEDYAIYQVATDTDGDDVPKALAPTTTLREAAGEPGSLTVRFGEALRGAR